MSEVPSIALNTFKGGVSKTTTAFNLAWKFTKDPNFKVLLVDADAQCNLTQVFLQHYSENNVPHADFTNIFRHSRPPEASCLTIGESLDQVVQAESLTPPPVATVTHFLRPNMFLLPGSMRITDYEQAIAHAELSKLGATKNIPGAFHNLVQQTARTVGADCIIIDTSPSMGVLNMVIVMSSMYFILPCQADFFSFKAVESIRLRMFEHGGTPNGTWIQRSTALQEFTAGTHNRLPVRKPRFLGALVQMFTIKNVTHFTAAFQHFIDLIVTEIGQNLRPKLEEHDMLVWNEDQYTNYANTMQPFILAKVKNFNRFAPMAQGAGIPVMALLEYPDYIINTDQDTGVSKNLTGSLLAKAISDITNMTCPLNNAACAVLDMINGVYNPILQEAPTTENVQDAVADDTMEEG